MLTCEENEKSWTITRQPPGPGLSKIPRHVPKFPEEVTESKPRAMFSPNKTRNTSPSNPDKQRQTTSEDESTDPVAHSRTGEIFLDSNIDGKVSFLWEADDHQQP